MGQGRRAAGPLDREKMARSFRSMIPAGREAARPYSARILEFTLFWRALGILWARVGGVEKSSGLVERLALGGKIDFRGWARLED